MNYKWNLNESNFTYFDRLKICKFFLNPKNRWTQGNFVLNYENTWSKRVGSNHAICVNSGSSANTLIAQFAAENNPSNKNTVVFPSVTWQTSVSPWINLGFNPKFIDVNLNDFSMDLKKLDNYLKDNYKKVNTVFITSLIGVTPDILTAKQICNSYNVTLKLDNCENIFGSYSGKHVCSELTSSTSLYFGHQTTTGSEGGIIFTNSDDEMVSYVLNRSHGLTRELLNYDLGKKYYKKITNDEVNEQFDFNTLGSNFRMSNIAAFMGSLDFEKLDTYIKSRKQLYKVYSDLISNDFILPKEYNSRENVMFCLPIILKDKCHKKMNKIKHLLRNLEIEYRPIISGNLLRQTCYKKYENYKDFKNAEHLHNYGVYVGLHPKLKQRQIYLLTRKLNIL